MQPGDLLTFDSLFSIIKETYSEFTLSQIGTFGDENHTISRSFDAQELLSKVPSFKSHLSTIYDLSTRDAIIESMTLNNRRDPIIVTIRWQASDQVIRPRLTINIMNLDFYIINPFNENYDF